MKTLTLTFTVCLCLIAGAFAKETELHHAAKRGDLELVQKLLSSNGNLPAINEADEDGFTPIMYAAKIGDVTIMTLLINKGADVNAQNKAGATALMLASKYGHFGTVKTLVNNGADPRIKTNNDYTAQQLASMYGHDDVVDYLKTVRYKAPKGKKA